MEEDDNDPPDEDSDEEGSLLDSSSESGEELDQDEWVLINVVEFILFVGETGIGMRFFYSTYSVSDVDGGGEGDPDEYYGDGYESSEEVCSHIV